SGRGAGADRRSGKEPSPGRSRILECGAARIALARELWPRDGPRTGAWRGCRRRARPRSWVVERAHRRAASRRRARLEVAAAIGLVEPFGVFLREFRPGIAALAQLAVELGLALGVEGAPAFLAVHRGLDEHRVDQVLDVPGLVGRQVAEAHYEFL